MVFHRFAMKCASSPASQGLSEANGNIDSLINREAQKLGHRLNA